MTLGCFSTSTKLNVFGQTNYSGFEEMELMLVPTPLSTY